MQLCPNCGGLTMMRDGRGWACQDPDCLQHLVIVQLDNTLYLPSPIQLVDADSVVNRFCVHGRSTTANPCPACNPLQRR